MSSKYSKYNIAILSIHSDPLAKAGTIESGGQNVYVRNLAKNLSKLGFYVDIFSRLDKKNKQAIIQLDKRLRVIRVRSGPRRFIPKTELLPYLPEFIANFLKFKTEYKLNYHLIHGNYWEAGWVAIQLKNILKIPLVETFHSLGYIRYHTLKKFQAQDIDSKEFKERVDIEKEIIENADRIIATSPFERLDLIKYYNALPAKIKLISLGVNTKIFKPSNKTKAREIIQISGDSKIILYVGRIEWRKGLEIIIRAVNILKSDLPIKNNWQVIIIGGYQGKYKRTIEQQEKERIIKLTEKLKLSDKVKFINSLPQKKLAFYYNAADVVVVPSYYEPFGLIPLEAMACQVPVVASRTGGLRYSIRHNKTGFLAPVNRPASFAKRISEILNKPEMAQQFGYNGYNRVQKFFSWSGVAKKMGKLYLSLINYVATRTLNH